jgi:hypothetical protein
LEMRVGNMQTPNPVLHRTRPAWMVLGVCRSPMRAGLLSFVVRLRHEGVAETVLLFREEVTTPAVLPAVCYRGVLVW